MLLYFTLLYFTLLYTTLLYSTLLYVVKQSVDYKLSVHKQCHLSPTLFIVCKLVFVTNTANHIGDVTNTANHIDDVTNTVNHIYDVTNRANHIGDVKISVIASMQ